MIIKPYWSQILVVAYVLHVLFITFLVAGKLKIWVNLTVFTFVLCQENISGNFYSLLAEFIPSNRDLVSLCVKPVVFYFPVTC